jgi:hypothetical protein
MFFCFTKKRKANASAFHGGKLQNLSPMKFIILKNQGFEPNLNPAPRLHLPLILPLLN